MNPLLVTPPSLSPQRECGVNYPNKLSRFESWNSYQFLTDKTQLSARLYIAVVDL